MQRWMWFVLFGMMMLPSGLLAADPIFEPGAKLKVEAGQGAGGEGPAWHPQLGVLSSGNGHIMRLTREGKSLVHREEAGTGGGVLYSIRVTTRGRVVWPE